MARWQAHVRISAPCFLCGQPQTNGDGVPVCSVFGGVTEGLDIVKQIETYGSQSGTPAKKVVITDCGQL